jgi:dipeptidyl-peptidase-4
MRRPAFRFAWILLLFSATCALGQKRTLGFEQIFKRAPSDVLQPLPALAGWVDDQHYIIAKKDDSGKISKYSVEVHSGAATLLNEPPAPGSQAAYHAAANEKNATLSPDGKKAAFTRNNNLFVKELATGKETQITTDGSDSVYNGWAAWLYYEEILGRSSRYKAFWWSPDSRHLAFMRFDESAVPVFPIYNAEGQHGNLERQHYPKAGDPNPLVKIGIVNVENPMIVWADFNPQEDQYFGTPVWRPDGGSLWVQWMPRSQQELKIYAVNPENGTKTELYSEKQRTWITLDQDDRIQFVDGNKYFILRSDKTGWMHLYLYNWDGKLINAITQGDFTVGDLEKISEKDRLIFFRARKENSARYDVYRIGWDGKGLKRISFGEYSHDSVSFSPGGKYFITIYSNLQTAPRMSLLDNEGKKIRELGDARGKAFDEYELSRTELVRVRSRDGLFELPMTITYPHNFDASKKYPVLISIYGGPNAGTVYDRWNTRGFLNAQWWAREGLIQVSMDNRSSGHFGKTGMDYIYRQMGKYEIEDYMDCGRWLRSRSYVDTTRIAITGGSFGGYMTCMALTYGSDVFTHGLANYSVTDWKLYDTHYTERYMGLPKENPEGYRLTSPQTYVQQYRGLLRIVHGTIDDNVHMQNSIQLINKLEDLDRNFECMIYPGERHGWGGPKAVHLRNESAMFIYTHLLNKPMPDYFWK